MVVAWNDEKEREREREKEVRRKTSRCSGRRTERDGRRRWRIGLTRPPEQDRIEPRAGSAIGVVMCRGSYPVRLSCSPACLSACLTGTIRVRARLCARRSLRGTSAAPSPAVAMGDTLVCFRTWMGVPARLSARPVPSRWVSHRSPPAIHSSFSQPPACQCPTARRTVCTQKRSGSPSLPRLSPSERRTRARARARSFFHPGESRIAYLSLYTLPLYIRFSLAPPLPHLPLRTLHFSLFSPTGRLAPSLSRFPLRLLLVFFFSAGFFLLVFCSSFSQPSVTLGNARAPTIAVSLLLAFVSFSLYSRRPPFGAFNLPPSHYVPPSAPPLGRCLRPEHERPIRSVSFASAPFVPVAASLFLAPECRAGVYSRCHLIAGRFSRVRYRSATESTESAAAASVARFPSSLALWPCSLFLRHLLLYTPPTFVRSACSLCPSFSSFPSRADTRRALYSLPCTGLVAAARRRRVRAASWWFPRRKRKEKSNEKKDARGTHTRTSEKGTKRRGVTEGKRKGTGEPREWREVRATDIVQPRLGCPISRLFFLLSRIFAGARLRSRDCREGGDTFGTWTRGTHGLSRWIREDPEVHWLPYSGAGRW